MTLVEKQNVITHIETRIDKTFLRLKNENRTGVISFTMAYDPDYETSLDILKSLPETGVDIIELGMPFSDPMADGPTIQLASIRALKQKPTLNGIFKIVDSFRQDNDDTPIILMGYYNTILNYGEENFCKKASLSGVDGVIIVDLPTEEDNSLFAHAQNNNISLIKLITPTTKIDRLKKILPKASGFLYYVSVAGITGTHSASSDSIQKAVTSFKEHTELPIAVGFGIKTAEQINAIGNIADAAVVGSALVSKIAAHPEAPQTAKKELLALARKLSLR